jgi:hypothetical protein
MDQSPTRIRQENDHMRSVMLNYPKNNAWLELLTVIMHHQQKPLCPSFSDRH